VFFKKKSVVPYLLMTFIAGLISVFDNVMNVVYADTLATEEKNPVASWIIEQWGVVGLVEIKAVGTVLAVALMCRLAYSKYRLAIIPVFLFQICLFLYLAFASVQSSMIFRQDMFVPIKEFFRFYL
tara:strand:- start:461 stop:838 length:378 start_codon:yes stop_codon:yes gene_type:complete